MIAFCIKCLRHGKHIARTVCDAESATFASLLDNDYLPPARPDALQIEGFSPVFHAAMPLLSFMPFTDLTNEKDLYMRNNCVCQ